MACLSAAATNLALCVLSTRSPGPRSDCAKDGNEAVRRGLGRQRVSAGLTVHSVRGPRCPGDLELIPIRLSLSPFSYALVLSATLLTGGRVADIFSSKWTFIVGFAALGVFNILLGFVSKCPHPRVAVRLYAIRSSSFLSSRVLPANKNAFLFLRAVSAFGASLTIPAATNLIIHLFPDPKEQAIAIALFGGSGAIANILGLIIGGALLVADYTW